MRAGMWGLPSVDPHKMAVVSEKEEHMCERYLSV
jgi:hypothetical protein